MAADVLGLELNRVSLPRSGSGESSGGAAASASAAAKTTVEVGPGDFFWEANGSSPFPAVAEEVDALCGESHRPEAGAQYRRAGAGTK